MEILAERPGLESWSVAPSRFAKIRNAAKRVFSCCWHLKLSLPFTRGDETYQTCVSCGARRRFDLDQWTSVGGFYYPKRYGWRD
jgi:hypothetical protein